jgi:DNA-binding SARP family transcriptional activator
VRHGASLAAADEQTISVAEDARVEVSFQVLGPVAARDRTGAPVDVRGPRHRAVLARLIVARGRTVPLPTLIDDLWAEAPPGAVGAVRTFVAALRRALEPDRAARAPARLIVTDGAGYAFRAGADAVDAWRFEQLLDTARDAPPARAVELLEQAVGLWHGPAFADLVDEHWAGAERARLTELRLAATERLAQARLATATPGTVIADLAAHTAEHPWREEGWRLLALALHRDGRPAEALDVLRRARARLADELGLDPGERLTALEADVLRRAPHLDLPGSGADGVWARATSAGNTVGQRAKLEAAVVLLHGVAMSGPGPAAAAEQRLAAVAAAEQLGDPELTARVISGFDLPGVWARSDDPAGAAALVAAAERTLAALPTGPDALGARLLTVVALESRGLPGPRGPAAADEAEQLARRSGEPTVLAFALAGRWMQSFHRAGLAAERAALATEILRLAERTGLPTFAVLGHLALMQSGCALGDVAAAQEHADAADELGARHERPLAGVFTGWFRALQADTDDAYRDAAARLHGAGMPGVEQGLLPLALLCRRLRLGLPVPDDPTTDWGPYAPWVRPVLAGADAAPLLDDVPDPSPDHLLEVMWCLVARAALSCGHHAAATRAAEALAPAAGEIAAGSAMVTLGPVAEHLAELRGSRRLPR